MGSARVRASGVLAAVLIAGCSGATSSAGLASSPVSTSPSATISAAASGTATLPTTAPASTDSLGLVVLTRGSDPGLWTVSRSGVWTKVRTMDGGAAIAPSKDGVAVVSSEAIRYLKATDLSDKARIAFDWAGGPAKPIVSFGVAEDGRVALVVGKDDEYSYAIADALGKVGATESPASPPFAPLVAWLGPERRLLLVTDTKQVSRLAVEDASRRLTALTGLGGCRWFGVSGDGKSIAALTEGGLYVDTTDRFLADAEPQKVSAIAGGTVAWALALNRDGSELALLTGSLTEDGSVTELHEQVLAKTPSGWQQTQDSKLPFGDVVGQAWTN